MKTRIDVDLSLDGLTLGPAQVWGSVRLVPLLRQEPIADLRIGVRGYDPDALGIVGLNKGEGAYLSFVPHGLVMAWGDDADAEIAAETRLGAKETRQKGLFLRLHRMAKREGKRRLRLLPLHFGGPDVAWACWKRSVLRHGLDPRWEYSVRGESLPGLDEALRLFEIHPKQVGMLVFVADAFASATVVPHPDDYFALHRALVQDFYGYLLYQYGWSARDVPAFGVELGGDVASVDDIRVRLDQARADWARFAGEMASGVLGRTVSAELVRTAGRFRLLRFFTGFDVRKTLIDGEHLGEVMLDDAGRIAYLKTYRLEKRQVRRGRMLSDLATHDWNPVALAKARGLTLARLNHEIGTAGLAWMLKEDWRTQMRRRHP